MKTWEEAKIEFNLSPGMFLKWFGVVEAVPQPFRQIIRNDTENYDEIHIILTSHFTLTNKNM